MKVRALSVILVTILILAMFPPLQIAHSYRSESWRVSLNVHSINFTNVCGNLTFGVDSNAIYGGPLYQESIDPQLPPPPYLAAFFDSRPPPAARLKTSILAPTGSNTWILTIVYARNGPISDTVNVTWSLDDFSDVPEYRSIFLRNPSTGDQVNMRVQNVYSFNVTVPIGSSSVSVNFELIATVRPEEVNVRVYGPNDTPISGATVILYDHLTGEWVNYTVTNTTGIAAMTVPVNVDFDILIYKLGYGTIVPGEVLGHLFNDNAGVGYNAPNDLNFTLSRVDYGTLRGTVLNATDNAPLEGATVSILAYDRGRTYWVNSTTTLSNGSYTVGLNAGPWRLWIDRKVDGNRTHLGTWISIVMTANATVTKNFQLWPKARLSIVDLSIPESGNFSYSFVLINDTYGGAIWRKDVAIRQFPHTEEIPAVEGMLLVTAFPSGPGGPGGRLYVYSSNIDASAGGTVTLNATLSSNQYDFWNFPSDGENDRLFGNLTMETYVVAAGTAGGGDGGGPPQFTDPAGVIRCYLMADRGSGTPTVWSRVTTPIRTDVGCFYSFFDLVSLNAPEGYYTNIILVKNSTGHVTAATTSWFNMFQYQVQPLQFKSVYDVGENVDIKFKVYGASSYTANVVVRYALYNSTWRFERQGHATVNPTTKVWNLTLPSGVLKRTAYQLLVTVVGGREQFVNFAVQDYTPIRFSGTILPNATIFLWSERGPFLVTANGTGFFDIRLPQGAYGSWFHYDNKDTPGLDANDIGGTQLTLTTDVTNFPTGFEWYTRNPMEAVFEVRGIVFNDANRNGRMDSGEARLSLVNLRAENMSWWQEWCQPSNPDGSYRMFLRPGEIWKLKATKSIYQQNETATPAVGAGARQGDLVMVNIPMEHQPPGNITGYVKLDNGTALENAGLHFMDAYWSWIGSTFTDSNGHYLFTAPANKKLNIWADPNILGMEGRDVRGIIVGVNQTLHLNITIYRTTSINGTVQVNGTGVWAQILPLDENWNRLTWDRGSNFDGSFQFSVPAATKKLLILSWGWTGQGGFLIKDVNLTVGAPNNLGVLNLTATDPNISINVYAKNWAYEWLAGQRVDFNVELRNTTMWQPIRGADVIAYRWIWDNGTAGNWISLSETSTLGVYAGNFTPIDKGHYRLLVLANVSASRPHIAFQDLWISVTDKKLYLIEGRGEYGLGDVQNGTAKIRVKLLSTTDGSPIANYQVWFEIRGFTNMTTWQMETAVARTKATDLGSGIYEITIPSTLGSGSYWMDILAGDWETTQHLGFTIKSEPTPTVDIYGWVTRSPTPVQGAIIETWMEGSPYLFVTSTDANGYYRLPVPEKRTYHMHIYYDNVTTPGIDYTTIPEWKRIQVMALDIENNATVAHLGEVTLTILRAGQPTEAQVIVWDSTTAPSGAIARLVMWAGTWKGAGLFSEKLKEGRYTFEVGVFWPPELWHYWWDSPLISAEEGLASVIQVPTYNVRAQGPTDILTLRGGAWRVKTGETVTLRIWEQNLHQIPGQYQPSPPEGQQQQFNLTAQYLLQNCSKRFEVFHWVPGMMAEGFAYNVTWVLKQDSSRGAYLEANFTIPTYFTGGDYGIYIFFYNTTGQTKVFVKVEAHLLIVELDMALAVVPFSAAPNGTVMAAALLMSEGVPATNATVVFEVYNNRWELVTIVTGREVAPGIYVASFTVPGTVKPEDAGWWTIKAVAIVRGRESVAYQSFEVETTGGSK